MGRLGNRRAAVIAVAAVAVAAFSAVRGEEPDRQRALPVAGAGLPTETVPTETGPPTGVSTTTEARPPAPTATAPRAPSTTAHRPRPAPPAPGPAVTAPARPTTTTIAVPVTAGPRPAASVPAPPGPNSAHRNVFWHDCDDLTAMTDAELDEWKNRGVGGFICATAHLVGMGGSQAYTGDPSEPLTGESRDRQRRIRSSRIIPRVHERGMKIYFSFYLANYDRPLTPFGDWFDDELWRATVFPAVGGVGAMARLEGFDGLAFDQENYVGRDQRAHSWDWSYGHTRSEAEVREKVRQRGREIMETLVAAYPGVALSAYHWNLPGSWSELVKHKVNKAEPDNAKYKVFIDFFDGLTGVEGYSNFSLLDAVFYKSTHLGASWETALAYNANHLYATLSRRLHRWDYAASRVRVVPFAWIDHNDKEWPYRAQTAEEVQKQLAAFRLFSVGDEFANFVYHTPMSKYDYSPYLPAMREAATPGRVDDVAPTLAVADPSPSAGEGQHLLRGSAHDNLALRSVRWSSDRGGAGPAPMTMVTKSGDPSTGYEWEMGWEASVPVVPGANTFTITVEDIKGLTTTATVTIQG